MKALCKFYDARPLSWTNAKSGEIKSGWIQPYDLDQGHGIRLLQGEIMRMKEGEVVASGEYEVDYQLEKSNNNRLNLTFIKYRPIKMDNKPQVVNS